MVKVIMLEKRREEKRREEKRREEKRREEKRVTLSFCDSYYDMMHGKQPKGKAWGRASPFGCFCVS